MEKKVVLITGCSSGIGRASAAVLSLAGYDVIATARRVEELKGIGAAMDLRLDVADEGSIKAAVKAVIDKFGKIDVLINNAGYGIRGAIEELNIDAVNKMFDVNVNGIIRMVQAVVPSMRENGSGRIINIGSVAGKITTPVNGAYAATKHAVEALSDALRWELSPFGISVILIEPANIRTDFKKTAELNSEEIFGQRNSPYAGLYAGFTKANAALRSHEPGPEAVTKVILGALQSRHPRARYTAAIPPAMLFLTTLPDGVKDFAIKKFYKIGQLHKKR